MMKMIALGIQLVISIINLITSKNKGMELKSKVFDAMVKSDRGFDILQGSAKLRREHEEIRKERIKSKG